MTKQTGLGDNLYYGGYNLSGDTQSLGRIGGGPNPWDTTGIDKSGMERTGLLRDGGIDWVSYFNPTAAQAHPRLSLLPYTDVIITYCRGTALGDAAASMVSKQVNYDGDRPADGSFTFTLNALANAYGIEWGDQLTAGQRTDTGATAGTAFDSGAATTNFGLQAYLQVFSFTGTDVTVKIQESSDNAGDAYADVVGGGFTQITGGAPLTQRIATATNLAVERYLKVTTVTTGGFSSLVFAVMCVRNPLAPAF